MPITSNKSQFNLNPGTLQMNNEYNNFPDLALPDHKNPVKTVKV